MELTAIKGNKALSKLSKEEVINTTFKITKKTAKYNNKKHAK